MTHLGRFFLILGLFLILVPELDAQDGQSWNHLNLGQAFFENAATTRQAVETYEQAYQEMEPGNPLRIQVRLFYGLALLKDGRTGDGIDVLSEIQNQDPTIPHTWFNLGMSYKQMGRMQDAIRQLEQMVNLVPNEPVSHYNLGELYQETGQQQRAVQSYRSAIQINPNLAAPHARLAEMAESAGRNQEAQRQRRFLVEKQSRMEDAAVPEDMTLSYFSWPYTIGGSTQSVAEPESNLSFSSTSLTGSFDSAHAGQTTLDADGDSRPDLMVWSESGAVLFRNGTATTDAGLDDIRQVRFVAADDFDNDGLSDVCILTDSGVMLFVNNDGTFVPLTQQLPSGSFDRAVWLDYDHDYDVDLFLLGSRSVLMRNNGSGGFTNRTDDFPFIDGTVLDATPFSLIPDDEGAADLVVTYAGRPTVLYRDRLGGRYEALTIGPEMPRGIDAHDINNDGWLDLVAGTQQGAVLILNNEGQFQRDPGNAVYPLPVTFVDLENRGTLDMIAGGTFYEAQEDGGFVERPGRLDGLQSVRSVTVADFNGDGLNDLAVLNNDGRAQVLSNQTQTDNNWIGITPRGIRNRRLTSGALVEIKAGPMYQKKRFEGVPLVFGLGESDQVDVVRITWPNGLVQNELNQPTGRLIEVSEGERLSGSCPMIFSWNGSSFEFITDVLGVAPLGASAGDGNYFPVDHDEYIQIPGTSLARTEDDQYLIRITEELREVAYLDQIQLLAVDHPSDVDVFVNDKFIGPPFPEFRLYSIRDRWDPVRAVDHEARDVRDRLLKRDRTYPTGFTRTYSGTAEKHFLELDFGRDAALNNDAVLVLNGWVDWADGSTFLGASQEPDGGLIPPYLQVKDENGVWQTVIEDMGLPAGKPKTIVVDLTDKFLSDAREIRIVTNLCLYWDEIFLGVEVERPDRTLSTMDAVEAELLFGGFSAPTIHPERKQPEVFDYSRKMSGSMWDPTRGMYTRYGEVKELIHTVNDKFVIMGSGDELQLAFNAASLPELKQGYERNFLLKVDGWAKDGDMNTAFSQSVEPLPFHGMSQYPYPDHEHYPDDEEHRRYRETYNTRPALKLLRPLSRNGVPTDLPDKLTLDGE